MDTSQDFPVAKRPAAETVREVFNQRRGVIMAWVAVALPILLGAAALTIDVGRLMIAAQVAQNTADAAALAGGQELPNNDTALWYATALVDANKQSFQGAGRDCWANPEDIVFYGPGDEIPGFGLLGPAAWGIRVTVHVSVRYAFAGAVGLREAAGARSCTVVRMPLGGVPVCPMWISYNTEYNYGDEQQLLMADGPSCAGIPGSFGWIEPPSGQSNLFLDLLRGYNLTYKELHDNYVSVDDILTAYTGLSTGQWAKALNTAPDGLARLDRAQGLPWTNDTFDAFHDTNPRIIIVPMVEYLGGTGSGAQFRIKAFGAFYIESINSKTKPYAINGRFLDYSAPGAGGDPLSPESGLWVVQMVK